jgi:hypothetical protein
MKIMKITKYLWITFVFSSLVALGEEFNLAELPRGTDVTLNAKTLVQLPDHFEISATDLPQSVGFTTVFGKNQKSKNITLEIKNKESKETSSIILKPGQTALYPFSKLSTIKIAPLDPKSSQGIILQITSDKPLTYAR